MVPTFPGQLAFWGLIASRQFDSGTVTQTEIRHPTLHYFIKVLENTLLCKMEPKKVRVHEFTLLFRSVRWQSAGRDGGPFRQLGSCVCGVFGQAEDEADEGHVYKEGHSGELLTPIFRHLVIRIDGVTVIRNRLFMDADHLTSTQWLHQRCF